MSVRASATIIRRLHTVFGVLVIAATAGLAWMFFAGYFGLGTFILYRIFGLLLFVIGSLFAICAIHAALCWILASLSVTAEEREKPAKSEIALSAETAPKFFRAVEMAAEGVGLPVPAEIRIAPDCVCRVESRRGKSVLICGPAFLSIVPQKRFIEIIAHAIVTRSVRDTARESRVRHYLAFLKRIDNRFRTVPPGRLNYVSAIFGSYHLLSRWRCAKALREASLEADQRESERTDADRVAIVLMFQYAMARHAWSRVSSVADYCLENAIALDEVFAQQAERFRANTPGDWQHDVVNALEKKTEPFDAIPALRERLKALGYSRETATPLSKLKLDGPSASEWIPEFAALAARIANEVLGAYRDPSQPSKPFAKLTLEREL